MSGSLGEEFSKSGGELLGEGSYLIRAVMEERELFRQGRAGKGIPCRGSHVGKCSTVRNSC